MSSAPPPYNEVVADRNRSAAVASIPSLFAIAAAFFLPFVRGCDAMVVPLGFVRESLHRPLVEARVVPPFAVAALLALLTVVAMLRRRAPDRVSERIAFAGVGVSAVAMLVGWYFLVTEASRIHVVDVFHVAIGALGLRLYWTAFHREGWTRWERLVAAHAAFAAPLCELVVTARFADVGLGGWCYTVGVTILLFLFAVAQRP
jgi:hypothetical protein